MLVKPLSQFFLLNGNIHPAKIILAENPSGRKGFFEKKGTSAPDKKKNPEKRRNAGAFQASETRRAYSHSIVAGGLANWRGEIKETGSNESYPPAENPCQKPVQMKK